jgi:hypothetical protein
LEKKIFNTDLYLSPKSLRLLGDPNDGVAHTYEANGKISKVSKDSVALALRGIFLKEETGTNVFYDSKGEGEFTQIKSWEEFRAACKASNIPPRIEGMTSDSGARNLCCLLIGGIFQSHLTPWFTEEEVATERCQLLPFNSFFGRLRKIKANPKGEKKLALGETVQVVKDFANAGGVKPGNSCRFTNGTVLLLSELIGAQAPMQLSPCDAFNMSILQAPTRRRINLLIGDDDDDRVDDHGILPITHFQVSDEDSKKGKDEYVRQRTMVGDLKSETEPHKKLDIQEKINRLVEEGNWFFD